MSKADSKAISFRISGEKLDRLEYLAEATDRPRSWHIEQALSAYLDLQSWQIEHIAEGVADAEAGRVAAHEDVRAWLSTWGTEDEGQPPE